MMTDLTTLDWQRLAEMSLAELETLHDELTNTLARVATCIEHHHRLAAGGPDLRADDPEAAS